MIVDTPKSSHTLLITRHISTFCAHQSHRSLRTLLCPLRNHRPSPEAVFALFLCPASTRPLSSARVAPLSEANTTGYTYPARTSGSATPTTHSSGESDGNLEDAALGDAETTPPGCCVAVGDGVCGGSGAWRADRAGRGRWRGLHRQGAADVEAGCSAEDISLCQRVEAVCEHDSSGEARSTSPFLWYDEQMS